MRTKSYIASLQGRAHHATLLKVNSSFIISPLLSKDSEQLFSSKLLFRTTQGIVKLEMGHAMDMVVPCKQKVIFLKLVVAKK